jgi:tungstate transport system permease protein
VDLLRQGLIEAILLILRRDPTLLEVSSLSLVVSLSATLLAAVIGIPTGVALAIGHFRGKVFVQTLVNTGMGLPPVVVGLVITVFLWRSGPLGPLQLLYTPQAMVLAQLIVAAPIIAGLTRSAIELLSPDILQALRVDGAHGPAIGRELVRVAQPQVLVAVAAGFGRAIAEVGASLMVGGNIAGHTRILTTDITLETGRGNFSLAIALGIVLLALSFIVNLTLHLSPRLGVPATTAQTL